MQGVGQRQGHGHGQGSSDKERQVLPQSPHLSHRISSHPPTHLFGVSMALVNTALLGC